MSLFEFIIGMISIIFALGVAQLFVRLADLLQHDARVRFFLPHAIWVVNLFLLTYLHWWSLWTFRELSWNFGMFFYSLVGPSMMFFACTMISPRFTASTDVDLMVYFHSIRKLFLSVFAVIIVLFSFDGPLFGTEQLFNELRAAQMLIAAAALWGIFSDSNSAQVAISAMVLLSISAIVFIRFLPGQYLG